MCQASTVTDDWVTKGCHIHVNGVELNVFSDHRGRIDFRSVFSTTPVSLVQQAIKMARELCLPDPDTRKKWIRRLEMARVYMLGYEGEPAKKARGRMLEFKFIRIALQRWEDENGDA
jgi:hypothetical protein